MSRKALITGASEGIGRAIAKKLASEAYSLTLVARNQERLEKLVEELGSDQHKIVVADLTRSEDVLKIGKLLQYEHHNILVNNAGMGYFGKFSELDLDDLTPLFRLNCETVFVLSHTFLKYAQAGDALINVSSILAFLPLPYSATYSATKSFITTLSEALWYEEKKRDVFVMNLCPGLTKTEFQSRAGGRREKTPPEFMFQTTEDVVEEMYRVLRDRKQPTLITGLRNRIVAFVTRLLTRRKVVKVLGISG